MIYARVTFEDAQGRPLYWRRLMDSPKISPQRKFEDMQARQREALRLEEVALDATRAKTARLRAQRLEREKQEASAPKKGRATAKSVKAVRAAKPE